MSGDGFIDACGAQQAGIDAQLKEAAMLPLIRVMRLWTNGICTPIWTGYHLEGAQRWLMLMKNDGRVWIERENQPAVTTVGWRPV